MDQVDLQSRTENQSHNNDNDYDVAHELVAGLSGGAGQQQHATGGVGATFRNNDNTNANSSSNAREFNGFGTGGSDGGDGGAGDSVGPFREVLEQSGALAPIKAQLRAAIFHALNDSMSSHNRNPSSSSAASVGGERAGEEVASPEAKLINELIRDYLLWHGYEHSLSVFSQEARLSPIAVPSRVLADTVGVSSSVTTSSNSVPVLFHMLAATSGLTASAGTGHQIEER